jgi:hypothetical protein
MNLAIRRREVERQLQLEERGYIDLGDRNQRW